MTLALRVDGDEKERERQRDRERERTRVRTRGRGRGIAGTDTADRELVKAIHGRASSKPNCQEASRGQVPLNSSILLKISSRACADDTSTAAAGSDTTRLLADIRALSTSWQVSADQHHHCPLFQFLCGIIFF